MNELDGQLGVLPPSSGQLLMLVGACTGGPLDTPATFARVPDLVAAFVGGPAVEAAAYAITNYGNPVAICRAGSAVAGTVGTIDVTGKTGTSVPTVHAAPVPVDAHELYLLVTNGGTLGVTGIKLRYSLDDGRTLSPVISLGTALVYPIPESGVQIDFAAGTLVTGDVIRVKTTAPNFDSSTISTSLTAIRNTAITWKLAEIVGAIDNTTLTVIDSAFVGMAAAHKWRAFAGNTRTPTRPETEAAYLSSLSTAFASSATKFGMLCAGDAKIVSGVSGRIYRRPISVAVAALQANVSDEIDIADINIGKLPGVKITDVNGNNTEHDESLNPGLDDARFVTLRTWDTAQGVYVNRPRVFSPDGSDFDIMPKRLVLNLAQQTCYAFLVRRLNRGVTVNKTTGFITEAAALDIESGADAAVDGELLTVPKASDSVFVLNRNDNVLSTKTIRGQLRVTPLGYLEFIEVQVSYVNPALLTQAA